MPAEECLTTIDVLHDTLIRDGWLPPAEAAELRNEVIRLRQQMSEVSVTEMPKVSFGDGLVRDDDSSYNRPCGNPTCAKRIHRNNTAGLCTDCFVHSHH